MSVTVLRDKIDMAGLASLRDRLRTANAANPHFTTQFGRLVTVLEEILRRLETEFDDRIQRVMAVGDWAREGIDLRALPCDDIAVLIVVRFPERPIDLYLQIAGRVFADLGDDDIGVQFGLETHDEWEAGAATARLGGVEDALGVPLLVRV